MVTCSDGKLSGDKLNLPPSILQRLSLNESEILTFKLTGLIPTSSDDGGLMPTAAATTNLTSFNNQMEAAQTSVEPVQWQTTRFVYGCVREFTAEEDCVEISPFLSTILFSSPQAQAEPNRRELQIELVSLHKGTFVQLRSLQPLNMKMQDMR